MAASYKKLWKLLIDKDIKKQDLCKLAGISHATLGKMRKSENVTVDILARICRVLECEVGDIMEFVDED